MALSEKRRLALMAGLPTSVSFLKDTARHTTDEFRFSPRRPRRVSFRRRA